MWFFASICASVNDEVVYGIPGLRQLENGDIISIVIGSEINRYYGDSAKLFPLGDISSEAEVKTLADKWTVVTLECRTLGTF